MNDDQREALARGEPNPTDPMGLLGIDDSGLIKVSEFEGRNLHDQRAESQMDAELEQHENELQNWNAKLDSYATNNRAIERDQVIIYSPGELS